jgi:hypothetical protein
LASNTRSSGFSANGRVGGWSEGAFADSPAMPNHPGETATASIKQPLNNSTTAHSRFIFDPPNRKPDDHNKNTKAAFSRNQIVLGDALRSRP